MRSAKSVLRMPNRRVMYTWPLEGLSVVKGNFHAAFLGGWAAVTSLRLPGAIKKTLPQ